MIRTKDVRNARVYYDDRHPNRWVDAIGSNVVKFELPVALPQDDSTDNPTTIAATEVGTNSALSAIATGDRMIISTGVTEYNGMNLQAHGSAFKIVAGQPLYFGIRAAMENGVGKGDYLFGLCEIDTTLLATSAAHAVSVTDDGVYFYMLEGETTVKWNNELGGVIGSIDSEVAPGSGIYRDYEFFYDGAILFGYIDGALIGSVATGLADQALTASLNVRTGDDGTEILNVQWMKAIQIL